MSEASEQEKEAETATVPPVNEVEGDEPRQIDFDFRGSWPFEDTTVAGDSLFLTAAPSQFYSDSSPLGPFLPTAPSLHAEYAGDLLPGVLGGPLVHACQGLDETVCENKSNNMEHISIFSTFSSEHSNASCSLKEKISRALRHLKKTAGLNGLFQVWVPVKNGNKHVLTTLGQPFVLDPHDTGLLQYRTVSLTYTFSVDGDRDDELGIPGRVFRKKTPEWTPNVQYYSSKEYPRLYHALNHNIQGTLALPIFEPSGQTCVGVIELIMMSPKINYAPEVDKVCKALEAVNLRSSEVIQNPSFQICNEGRQAAFAEILEILTVTCETYNLPLAQTWISCRHGTILAQSGGSKKSCSSFDGSCMEQVCMSTTDVAFYVVDARMWGFRDACAEHHLQKGQGVTGRAYGSGSPCFSRDITQFCKIEYPLVHYARMFELASCIAIHLQSSYTGKDDYILEFFLPSNCRDSKKQDFLLDHIVSKMQQCFRSLKVVGEMGLQGNIVEINKNSNNEIQFLQSAAGNNSCGKNHRSAIAETELPNFIDILQAEQHAVDIFPKTLFPAETDGENNDEIFFFTNNGQMSGSLQVSKNTKLIEKKRGKPEKFISLEVLQKYFSGSLKDAAKSLGVCPTTMKRICRQHGITRWPSRKINKVNTSLSKLKQVIESVQVADGAFSLTSLTNGDMSVGSFWPVNLDELKQNSSGIKASDLVHIVREGITAQKSSESEARYEKISYQQEYAGNHCNGFQPEPIRDLNNGKTTCFTEESARNAASQSSSQESSANGYIIPGPSTLSIPERGLNEDCNLESAYQIARSPSVLLSQWTPDARQRIQPEQLQLPMQNSGRPIDLSNLCSVVAEAFRNEPEQETPQTNQLSDIPAQGSRIIVVKANYKEDVIRFRMLSSAGFVALKEEVAARLKLETGTFDIRYVDDYHEWVMLSCDSDLEECIELSLFSGERVVRLSVRDLPSNLGSSCESSGEEFLRATTHAT